MELEYVSDNWRLTKDGTFTVLACGFGGNKIQREPLSAEISNIKVAAASLIDLSFIRQRIHGLGPCCVFPGGRDAENT